MKNFLIIVLLLIAGRMSAQGGGISGTITDERTGEEIIGATIIVVNSDPLVGAITDFDGNYKIESLEAGTYNIQCSFISYEKKTITDVLVKAGEVTVLNFQLGEATTDLGEVVVTAKEVRRTEGALLTLQHKSATVMDGISSEQMSRLGDDNAASSLKRVTGVSVEGGKYIYVRGLSDRYSKTTLNGAEIPGLDPNKNAVQMDLFPSNIIDNIIIRKTFSPDLPGDFAGGYVDIETKDFPDEFYLTFSTSLGYNSQANLISNFLTYKGGKTDWLGIDDGTRAVPSAASGKIPSLYENNDLLDNITRSFNKVMEPELKKTPFNQNYSLTLGNQVNLFEKPFGYVLALSYKKDYNSYTNGTFGKYSFANNTLNPYVTSTDNKSEEEVIWSALVNLNYKLSNNHKIGLNIMHNQSGNSATRFRQGRKQEDNLNIQERTLGYLERSITNAQLSGKHILESLGKTKIDWFSSYTFSTQNEPDLRFFNNDFLIDAGEDTIYRISPNAYPSPARFYREMQELNFDNKIHIEIPFNIASNPSKIKFGGAYLYKTRNSDEKKFTILAQQLPYSGSVSEYLSNENIGQNAIPNNSNVTYGTYMESSDLTNQVNSYEAFQSIISGYALTDLALTNKIRIIAGARLEYSNTDVNNKVDATNYKYKKGTSTEIDLLPSINMNNALTEKMNFRVAYSRTLGRPVFRELAPYAAYDFREGIRKVGNPDLKRALIDNVDLRWEYFMQADEIISVSAFYKYFNRPIEQQDAPEANNTEIHYVNADDSKLYGIELELRKNLDFIGLKDLSFGGNFTFIKSIYKEDETFLTTARLTDPNYAAEREMFGQSPYIVNAYLGYKNTKLGLAADLGFNIAGEKIILITKGGTPNIYEQPRALLDFKISKSVGKSISIKFSAKNLLNSEYLASYNFEGSEKAYLKYKLGTDFSFGFTYTLK